MFSLRYVVLDLCFKWEMFLINFRAIKMNLVASAILNGGFPTIGKRSLA